MFQAGNDVYAALHGDGKIDSIEFYSQMYAYQYKTFNPYIDPPNARMNYYWDKVKLSIDDIDQIIYKGQFIESTLGDASFGEIPASDTLWMSTPIIDSYRIGFFDSIVSNLYVSGCNYGFYVHSNSKEVKAFMDEVRALDKELLNYALKKYGENEEDVNYGFELDDEKIEYMFKMVDDLLIRMGDKQIILILDCFD